MFGVEKERVVKMLQLLRESRCAYCFLGEEEGVKSYEREHFCDCKYLSKDDETLPKNYGEYGTGCPELANAFKVIQAMTDEEYRTICERAGVSLR